MSAICLMLSMLAESGEAETTSGERRLKPRYVVVRFTVSNLHLFILGVRFASLAAPRAVEGGECEGQKSCQGGSAHRATAQQSDRHCRETPPYLVQSSNTSDSV